MTDSSTGAAGPFAEPSPKRTRIGWALSVGFAAWIVGFFAWWTVSWAIEAEECGLDPYTEYETEKCVPVSAWGAAAAYMWIAAPVVWIAAALFLWLAPRRLVRARRIALWSIPLLPVGTVAVQVPVYVLYGPPPP
ncbi:hypothetical protein [Streptosporangium sp. NPDC051022]|uniref:hypothetical protein n=1 Tax=Streptosporangium sp. NPDC051022 TaxID=3155752 RepID=UPI00341AAF40